MIDPYFAAQLKYNGKPKRGSAQWLGTQYQAALDAKDRKEARMMRAIGAYRKAAKDVKRLERAIEKRQEEPRES